MPVKAKGDLEAIYGGPWGGVDYSVPYNMLDAQHLAPGTVNCSQHNGFLSTSPWLGESPYSTTFGNGEFVLGIKDVRVSTNNSPSTGLQFTCIVTNVAVYLSQYPATTSGTPRAQGSLVAVHNWVIPGELNIAFFTPGECVSFMVINSVIYMTGTMLQGVFSYDFKTNTFASSTYVCGRYLYELNGRLCVAQCLFPLGGGTGNTLFTLPVVAWSAVGQYLQFDPGVNPQAGFNELSDMPDEITGVATVGRSAFIGRKYGISQQDPGPSGLQPFTFYHLWSSAKGVGAYPHTMAQWGQTVIFRSDDNMYSVSLSAGVNAVGSRIMPKIDYDYSTLSQYVGFSFHADGPLWYFASMVKIAGQLHYLLTFSGQIFNNDSNSPTTFVNLVYDYNLNEDAWHIWDMGQMMSNSSPGFQIQFEAFSCPIEQAADAPFVFANDVPGHVTSVFQFLLIGGYTTLPQDATITGANLPSGQLYQFVPFTYDFATNPIVPYVSQIYTLQAMPVSRIVFRAEVGALGHKITARRLRIQADNAPLPNQVAGAQQLAQVLLQGSNSAQRSPAFRMQGNTQPTGMPIQTYYGDVTLGDEMVQASLLTVTGDHPFQSLAAFRIANASLIFTDTEGPTQ